MVCGLSSFCLFRVTCLSKKAGFPPENKELIPYINQYQRGTEIYNAFNSRNKVTDPERKGSDRMSEFL